MGFTDRDVDEAVGHEAARQYASPATRSIQSSLEKS